jgi:hypothetical protein
MIISMTHQPVHLCSKNVVGTNLNRIYMSLTHKPTYSSILDGHIMISNLDGITVSISTLKVKWVGCRLNTTIHLPTPPGRWYQLVTWQVDKAT